MGGDKLVHEIGGRTLLERAIAACGRYSLAIVVAPALVEFAERVLVSRSLESIVVVNDRSDLGMSHSLRLADVALRRPNARLAVVPADLPFLDDDRVDAVFDAAESAAVDVAYPRRADGTPGHPVVFGPRPRAALAALPFGDTIRTLRDDSRFTRRIYASEDPAFYFDVDTPEALERARERER
jgi:CTP:molybdopterin cytidylyltransferase MocA